MRGSAVNRDSIRRFYDEEYYRDATPQSYPNAHLRRLADRLQVRKDQQVLDVACGLGGWLEVCIGRGAHAHGIDLSSVAIECCRQKLPQATLHSGPAEYLPYPDSTFDLVTCLGSLEHFVDPEGALREMVRVSRPEARFQLLVPNADFLTRRLGLYQGTNQKDAMEVVRSLDEWSRLFESAGLRVEDRWKDLHVLSRRWIGMQGWLHVPQRLVQALLLTVWPLRWQYQVYHLCSRKS